jgi:hypothetical protein
VEDGGGGNSWLRKFLCEALEIEGTGAGEERLRDCEGFRRRGSKASPDSERPG